MRKLAKRKKVKKIFSRRLKAAYDLAPTDSFWSFKDFARTEVDKKETAGIIKDYIKRNFSKAEYSTMMKAPDWYFTFPYYLAASIQWKNIGNEYPDTWDPSKLFKEYFRKLLKAGEALKKNEVKTGKASPQDIIKQKISDYISELEALLDSFYSGEKIQINVFNDLQMMNAPYNMAKSVYDYYEPLRNEIEEFLKGKSKDLNEAYNHLTKSKAKQYLNYLNEIIDQAQQYIDSKKAVRKVRKPKVKTADKQVRQLKYLKESSEYKLTSINPITIIGGQRLYTFNTKTRMLSEYIALDEKGFLVKGTTLQNYDPELSRQTRLRKPQEFLQFVRKSTPMKINAEWKKLTTKTNYDIAGRINNDTIILRVLTK